MFYKFFTGTLSGWDLFSSFVDILGPGPSFSFFMNFINNIKTALSKSPSIADIASIIPDFAAMLASFWPVGQIVARAWTLAKLV